MNPTRTMVHVNKPEGPDPEFVAFSEDVFSMATQAATHWDALAHCSHAGVIYNGYPASSVTAEGAARCGIHRAGTVVSRGVLLDVARALGRDVLAPGLPHHPRRTSTRRARSATCRSSRATSCWCGPARWCTCSRTGATWSPTRGPRPG